MSVVSLALFMTSIFVGKFTFPSKLKTMIVLLENLKKIIKVWRNDSWLKKLANVQ